jgi:hypothetical protein
MNCKHFFPRFPKADRHNFSSERRGIFGAIGRVASSVGKSAGKSSPKISKTVGKTADKNPQSNNKPASGSKGGVVAGVGATLATREFEDFDEL